MIAAMASKKSKTVAIGSLVVSADGDDVYNVITPEQMRDMPFWPEVRGDSNRERCMMFIWDCFEAPEKSKLSNFVNGWIMILIVCSAVIAVVETIPSIHKTHLSLWEGCEHFFVANFSLEFIGKLISCPTQKLFWTTGMNYVDLIAILPYYVDIMFLIFTGAQNDLDISFLRILRLGRAFRLVKLGRYSQGVRLVSNALAASMDAMNLFLLVLVLVVVVFSSAIYYTERGEWNENQQRYYRRDPITMQFEIHPSTFQSIPSCFWWSITTLTTVGYGDMFPFTTEGKLMGTFTILVGLVMLALPLSILGTNFVEERMKMISLNANEVDVPELEPLNIIAHLEQLIEESSGLRGLVKELRTKADHALRVLKSINEHRADQGSQPEMACDDIGETEQQEQLSRVWKKTCAVPADKVEEFREACLELLQVAIVLKDGWDTAGNGLENLPAYVRDLIVPMIRGKVKRPYIVQGENKLYFGDDVDEVEETKLDVEEDHRSKLDMELNTPSERVHIEPNSLVGCIEAPSAESPPEQVLGNVVTGMADIDSLIAPL